MKTDKRHKAQKIPTKRKVLAIIRIFELFLKEMAKLVERLKRMLIALPEGETSTTYDIFNPSIDENKLADCLYLLYIELFGEDRKEMLEGKCDEVTFAVYLFILIEKNGLGKEDFGERSKSHFFNFMKEKVLIKENKDERTFRNRLKEFDDFHQYVLKHGQQGRDEQKRWEHSPEYRNFHKLIKNFHQTEFFRGIKRISTSV